MKIIVVVVVVVVVAVVVVVVIIVVVVVVVVIVVVVVVVVVVLVVLVVVIVIVIGNSNSITVITRSCQEFGLLSNYYGPYSSISRFSRLGVATQACDAWSCQCEGEVKLLRCCFGCFAGWRKASVGGLSVLKGLRCFRVFARGFSGVLLGLGLRSFSGFVIQHPLSSPAFLLRTMCGRRWVLPSASVHRS